MPNVLVVDDLPATVRILCNRIKAELGADVAQVRTLNQAWKAIKRTETPFALIIIDLYLPTDFDKFDHYKRVIVPGSFNQGELLGAFASEHGVPFFYYTSDPSFYRGTTPEREVVSKGEPVDRVLARVRDVLEGNP